MVGTHTRSTTGLYTGGTHTGGGGTGTITDLSTNTGAGTTAGGGRITRRPLLKLNEKPNPPACAGNAIARTTPATIGFVQFMRVMGPSPSTKSLCPHM
ncbi:MAG: hypothetical protein AMXMBFR13_36060 [Phycisphaerae bacterium]